MTLQSMLLRFQTAVGQDNLDAQMLLQPGLDTFAIAPQHSDTLNIVVGYNGSANSQIALDVALWMAHQTRFATDQRVVVHVVYVLDETSTLSIPARSVPTKSVPARRHAAPIAPGLNDHSLEHSRRRPSNTVTITRPDVDYSLARLEQADRLLWQARSLAEEWRGSLEAHLGCGDIATELRRVVELQAANLLIIGCHSSKHPLVHLLGSQFPCPVLGIPVELGTDSPD